ncbi:hypothetical protein Tco_0162118 [Tanacetum coccineum]
MASGGSDQDAKYALSKLLQKGTVAEYQSVFEILINRVTGISEGLLKTFYISGLKPALQCALLRSNPKTLDEAFSLARATEARFTDLQLWEFFRSNPSTLGEAFFKARITETRFNDERSITDIAKTNDLNTKVKIQDLEETTRHKPNKGSTIPILSARVVSIGAFIERKKSVGCGSGRQENYGSGRRDCGRIRIWDPGIKKIFQDNTLRTRWFRRSGE